MSEKDLNNLISRHIGDGSEHGRERTISFPITITVPTKFKLDALSAHLGIEKTQLFGQISEDAINDMFNKLFGEMVEHIKQGYEKELNHYYSDD